MTRRARPQRLAKIRGFFNTSTMASKGATRADKPPRRRRRDQLAHIAHINADGSTRNDASAPSAGTAFVKAFSKKNAGRIEKSRPPKFRPRPLNRLRNGSVTTKSGCNKGWPLRLREPAQQDPRGDQRVVQR